MQAHMLICRPIPEDGDVDVDMYNAQLAELDMVHRPLALCGVRLLDS